MISEAKKQEDTYPPLTEPGVEVRVVHRIPTGINTDPGHKFGQPEFYDNRRGLSWLLGQQNITHEDACKIYLEAQEREAASRTVREFWGAVLQNWATLTEPID